MRTVTLKTWHVMLGDLRAGRDQAQAVSVLILLIVPLFAGSLGLLACLAWLTGLTLPIVASLIPIALANWVWLADARDRVGSGG